MNHKAIVELLAEAIHRDGICSVGIVTPVGVREGKPVILCRFGETAVSVTVEILAGSSDE